MPSYALLAQSARPASFIRHGFKVVRPRCVRHCQVVYRTASTSAALAKEELKDATQTLNERQDETRYSLQNVRSVLASSLRLRGKASARPDSILEPLVSACDSLLACELGRDVRIAVYSEEDTPARDLVTVLLDDPLSSDATLRSAIQTRWTTREGSRRRALLFRAAAVDSDVVDENAISVASPFFTRFSHPVSLHGLSHSTPINETVAHLLEADVLIIVVSPFQSPSFPVLFTLLRNTHALLVVDSALNPASPSAKRLRSQVADKYGCDASRVLLVDTSRARRGATTLSKDPSSATTVRSFQEDVLASGIPALLKTLTDVVSLGTARLRADAELTMTKYAVSASKQVLQTAKEEVRYVRSRVSALQEHALEERECAEAEILGGDADLATPDEQGRIAKGVERAAVDIRPVLNGLTWYRLPFVVDDVSVRVDNAVERAFSREFEQELMFHTGRLSARQVHLVSRTMTLLASLPPTFQSSLLQNAVAQLTSAPSFPITSSAPSPTYSPLSNNSTPIPALLTPVRSRTAQLAHATRSLHLSAQRLLLLTFSTTTLSTVSSALLYVNTTADAASSIGAGLLGTLLGLRWAVGRWAHAREKWWGSFSRVGDGLARDMSSTLRGVLDRQICVVPNEACKGLQRLVERREKEIGEVEDEVEKLASVLEGPKENTARDKIDEDNVM
ncbi:uncharacterized protein FOMMEDRAFT_168331 [Fomitiporia mediterranea MF3/22]|uniref:uncharacterized protein n=1 Tax=Fomitiporia mediterranea (strain MF3/22) TaxID=694068 RepID=UPI0004408FC1|nr:uncharacterized protein FOMMEDRAFT_168331 [Fomitiporia mediterranea MF3/22]EJD03347.1 hypothetical protein FOMMEDRAFT_168331 [Fomitiporia mediterranea MF3/22]